MKCLMCIQDQKTANGSGNEEEIKDAVTLAPMWVANQVTIGLGQHQQMFGVATVPVCMDHISTTSRLATG